MIDLRHGDMRDVLPTIEADSVHSVVTDPPYHLTSGVLGFDNASLGPHPNARPNAGKPRPTGFMGKHWDGGSIAFDPDTWRAVHRVLKPGGYLLAMGGTRTFHRLACAIEDAGFEVRDTIAWVYGSGFPKSLDISKAIDKCNGDAVAWRRFSTAYAEAVHNSPYSHSDIDRHLKIKSSSCYWARLDHRGGMPPRHHWEQIRAMLNLPSELGRLYDEAEREVVGYAEHPSGLHRGKIADYSPANADDFAPSLTAPATDAARQWNGWGTALKPAMELICVARKPLSERTVAGNVLRHGTGGINVDACRVAANDKAKFPAGIVCAPSPVFGAGAGLWDGRPRTDDATPSARWPANLCHDASPEVEAAFAAFGERTSGTRTGEYANGTFASGMVTRELDGSSGSASRFFFSAKADRADRADSRHPTIKPVTLMQWLVRMVTPPGGTVLDPFAGSGTTGEAAMLEGFDAILVEREAEHAADIQHRQRRWHGGDLPLFAEAAD